MTKEELLKSLDSLTAIKIINKLDDYAREYDPYEAGLPLESNHFENMDKMVSDILFDYRQKIEKIDQI